MGANTVALDNPSLTVRGWSVRRQPLRVVLARHTPISPDARLLTDGLPTLIYSTDLNAVLADLYHRGITSLMVEGGSTVLQSFIDARMYDEVRIETAPITLGSGIKAPTLAAKSATLQSHKAYGSNTVATYSA